MIATLRSIQPRATAMRPATQPSTVATNWKTALPVLAGSTFTLREMAVEDAPSLFAMLTTEEVARFISPPPTTVEGFERFIMWAQRERQAGNYACFAIVPHGMTTAIGIFQVRSPSPASARANGASRWGHRSGAAASSLKARTSC